MVLINGARTTYTEVVANHFSEAADSAQTQLLNYVERISNEVGNLTRVAQILDVVADSNRNRLEGTDLDSQVEEREDDWLTQDPEDSRLQSGILNNEASRFVRKFNSITAEFREILVTDAMGRLVAASNKTSDYYQADERWWRYAYQEGHGNSFHGDIQFDESANVYGMEIAHPVRDPSSGEVMGVIKAIADSHEISALVAATRLGPTSEAVLISADGTGILGPERTVRYRFAEPISLGEPGRRYVEATEVLALPAEERRVFLGLPQFRLKDRMPELDWILVVQEPYEEVFFALPEPEPPVHLYCGVRNRAGAGSGADLFPNPLQARDRGRPSSGANLTAAHARFRSIDDPYRPRRDTGSSARTRPGS